MIRKMRLRRNKAASTSSKDGSRSSIFRKVRGAPPPTIAPAGTMTMSEEDEQILTIDSPKIRKISSVVLSHESSVGESDDCIINSVVSSSPVSSPISKEVENQQDPSDQLREQIGDLEHQLTQKEADLVEKQHEIVKLQVVMRELERTVACKQTELDSVKSELNKKDLKLSQSQSSLSLMTLEL